MTIMNQNLQATAPAREEITMQPQPAISVIGSGNTPQVDVTPVLLQNPHSPFAIALSVAIVIGAIAGLIDTIKSSEINEPPRRKERRERGKRRKWK
jgi:hypothetical protein